jgi:hypothetical protein
MGIVATNLGETMTLDIAAMFAQPTAAPKTMTAKAAKKASSARTSGAKAKKPVAKKPAASKTAGAKAKPAAKKAAAPKKRTTAKAAPNKRQAARPAAKRAAAPTAAPAPAQVAAPVVAMTCDVRCGFDALPGVLVGVSDGRVLVAMQEAPHAVPTSWHPSEVVAVAGIAGQVTHRALWDALQASRSEPLLLVG